MGNILLDYAVKFNQIESLPRPTFGNLHSVAIIVPTEKAESASTIIEVTDPAVLENLVPTYEAEINGIFDGGLNKVTLLSMHDINDLTALVADKETSFYTILVSTGFTATEVLPLLSSWGGVIGVNNKDKAEAIKSALLPNVSSHFFADASDSAYLMNYAFSKLLSAHVWRNQQYIQNKESAGGVVVSGDAESCFEKRVSFWIKPKDEPLKLSFFGAGGKSITTPYITKELEITIQHAMINFLAVNQPYNIALSRAQLENVGTNVINDMIELGYLNPDATNEIKISESNEAFTVSGDLTSTVSEAIWRAKINAYQLEG